MGCVYWLWVTKRNAHVHTVKTKMANTDMVLLSLNAKQATLGGFFLGQQLNIDGILDGLFPLGNAIS